MKNYKNTPELTLKYTKSNIEKVKIHNSTDVDSYVRQFYFDDINIYESFFIILLNQANHTVGFVKISQGGTAGTIIDIKIICKYAIDSLCHSVILCHNHPSGNLQPSDADINITKKIKEALELFDISLIEHIIITDAYYYSFADEKIL